MDLPLWVQQQVHTFAGWINVQLSPRDISVRTDASGLQEDLADGVVICKLMETLLPANVAPPRYSEPPRSIFEANINVQNAMDAFVRATKRPLVNIDAPMVTGRQNLRALLGLLWQNILFFHVNAITARDAGTDPDQNSGNSSGNDGSAKELLEWVNQRLPADEQVRNFDQHFRDGVAFMQLTNALLDEDRQHGLLDTPEERVDVDAFRVPCDEDGDRPDTEETSRRFECALSHAFGKADELLQIPALLDAALVARSPDKLSVITYVSFFRQHSRMRALQAPPTPVIPEISREELDELKRQLEEEKARSTQLRETSHHAQLELRNLLDELQLQKRDLESELEKTKFDNSTQAQEIEFLQQQCEALQSTSNEASAQQAQASERMRAQLRLALQDREKLKRALLDTRSRLQRAQSAGRSLRADVSSLQSQLEETRATVTTDQKVTTEEDGGLISLQQQLDSARRERDHAVLRAEKAEIALRQSRTKCAEFSRRALSAEDSAQRDAQMVKALRQELQRAQLQLQRDTRDACTQTEEVVPKKKTVKAKEPKEPMPSDEEVRKEAYMNAAFAVEKKWARSDTRDTTRFGMKKKVVQWHFVDENRNGHQVELQHSLVSGKRKIWADGVKCVDTSAHMVGDSQQRHAFQLSRGLGLEVVVSRRDGVLTYSLLINGVEHERARQAAATRGDPYAIGGAALKRHLKRLAAARQQTPKKSPRRRTKLRETETAAVSTASTQEDEWAFTRTSSTSTQSDWANFH